MTHSEKVVRLTSELSAKGVKKLTIAPPIFRLLWAAGIEIPPPLFLGFFPLAILMGLPAGLAMSVVYWLSGLPRILSRSVIFGFGFGLIMGTYLRLYNRWKAKRLNLPAWEDYGTPN
jgi:Family of unknown function (DUF6404)